MNREAELKIAIRALQDIANGHANNGVPYHAGQLRTVAREALEDMQQMAFVEGQAATDRGEW